jgi:acetyl esterase
MNSSLFQKCLWLLSAGVLMIHCPGAKAQIEDEDAVPKTKRSSPATHANVAYGPHERNVLDFWQASSSTPTPLLVFIHGGGFRKGDKQELMGRRLLQECLDMGISVASTNYRFSQHAIYPASMHDGARAIQFLRSKAKEWNLDPSRFGASGGSAGAGMSLWLAMHDDLADPKSEDPVARESTRLSCAAVFNGQSSYDPRFIKQIIPGSAYRHPGILYLFDLNADDLEKSCAEKASLLEDASAINHVSADDPPVFLTYTGSNEIHEKVTQSHGIHHPKFGEVLKEKLDPLKIECVVRWNQPNSATSEVMEFLKKHLKK